MFKTQQTILFVLFVGLAFFGCDSSDKEPEQQQVLGGNSVFADQDTGGTGGSGGEDAMGGSPMMTRSSLKSRLVVTTKTMMVMARSMRMTRDVATEPIETRVTIRSSRCAAMGKTMTGTC